MGQDLPVRSLHVLPVSLWVLSRDSGFLPQFRDMQFRLFSNSKLPVGVNMGVFGCLSLYIRPVMNWRLVQVVVCCPSNVSWDQLQPLVTL